MNQNTITHSVVPGENRRKTCHLVPEMWWLGQSPDEDRVAHLGWGQGEKAGVSRYASGTVMQRQAAGQKQLRMHNRLCATVHHCAPVPGDRIGSDQAAHKGSQVTYST